MSLPQTSYLCIPGWGEEVDGVTVDPIVAGDGVDSIDNDEGVCTSALSNYSTINADSAATDVEFTTALDFNPLDVGYDGLYTVALIGVRILPSTVDTVVRCALTAGSMTYQSAAAIYGQDMTRVLPVGEEGHQLLGSGLANIIFHDLPAAAIDAVTFALTPDSGSLASAQIRIGSIFVGLQIPFASNPGTWNWSSEVVNQQHTSRAIGNFSGDGVVRRAVSFEVTKTELEGLTGIGTGFYSGSPPVPNIFRASLASVGAPMLLSPYPYAVNDAWGDSPENGEITQRLRSVRQNFFSIYGLLDRRTEVGMREFNDGLNSEYRARLRYAEIR